MSIDRTWSLPHLNVGLIAGGGGNGGKSGGWEKTQFVRSSSLWRTHTLADDSHDFQPPQPLDANDPNHAILFELASLSVRTLTHVGRSLTDSRMARPMEILKACYVPAAGHAPKQTALACRMWFKLTKYLSELFGHRMERLQSADYTAAEENMVDDENTAWRTLLVADDERKKIS
ncbi:hypothetical protein BLNAU_17338 [Blattamonas nauphoetae]|nr:hypothetical protein BLNAU_17338 [Blattamonas nauphoetae]